MTDTPHSPAPGSGGDPDGIRTLLLAPARRARAARRTTALLAVGAALLGALGVAVCIDAQLGLSRAGRVALDAALLTFAVAAVVAAVRGVRRPGTPDARCAALDLERAGGVGTSRLINAVDLAADGRSLARLAVQRGRSAAQSLPADALTDRPARRRAARWAVAALAAAGLGAACFPGVVAAVAPRLLAPLSDHPPYTPLSFTVAAGPAPLSHGRPAVIDIQLDHARGPRHLPETAEVVFVDDGGAAVSRHFLRPEPRDEPQPPTDPDALASTPLPPSAYSHRLPVFDRTQRFYVATDRGRSRTFTLVPDTTPLFDALHATLRPPAYTRQPETTQRLPVPAAPSTGATGETDARDTPTGEPPRLRALDGTALTLSVESNVPLASATLAFAPTAESSSGSRASPSRDAPADPAAPATAHADTTLFTSGRYRLTLTGVDGRRSVTDFVADVTVLDDAPPQLDIASPEPFAIAPENWPVTLDVLAKDDVGLARVSLHAGVEPPDAAPGPFTETALFQSDETADAAGPPRNLRLQPPLDPAALGAGAGDTVLYYARAQDTRPAAGDGDPGQWTETPVFRLHLVSRPEWDAIAREQFGVAQIQAEWDALAAELDELAQARAAAAEELNALKEKARSGEPLTDADRQAMAELEAELRGFAEQARDLAKRMRERAEQPALYDFEAAYQEQLRGLADQLDAEAARGDAAAQAVREARKPGEAADPTDAEASPEPTDPTDPTDLTPPTDPAATPPTPGSPGTPSGPTPATPGGNPALPGLPPTALEGLTQAAEDFETPGDPFTPEAQTERRSTADDLEKFALADELVAHGTRIQQVIAGQRELATRLAELRTRDPDQLTAIDRAHLTRAAAQERAYRDELVDAALMLRETAELGAPLLPSMTSGAIALTERLDALNVGEDLDNAADLAELDEPAAAYDAAVRAADKLETLLSELSNQPGQASDDLDGCFKLPKAGIQNSLKQMAGRRPAVGMGAAGGGTAGSRGGTSGGGSPVAMLGPHPLKGGAADRASAAARNGGRGPGGAGPVNAFGGGAAETIDPLDAQARRGTAITVPGVPARYQDLAAAYFRRLADDARRDAAAR